MSIIMSSVSFCIYLWKESERIRSSSDIGGSILCMLNLDIFVFVFVEENKRVSS